MGDFSNVKPDVNVNVPVNDQPVTSPVPVNAETVTASTFEASDTLRQPYVPPLGHLEALSPPNPETPTPQAIGDNRFTLGQPLDPQPSCQDTIDRLLALGLPPLPVAPAQTNNSKFGGKNPSYLDTQGIPHLVSHKKYQKRQPTKEELQTWFENPLNGVGTLGNEECIWIDFDVKHFNDEVECSVKAWAIAGKVKELSGHDPTLERTHSGGWRVQVYVEEAPNFTNFALEPGGKYVGEALGTGRFTVLAPTIGPSGDSYTAYHRHCPETKPVVPSLEAIGIYPSSKSKSKASKSTPTLPLENTPPTDTTVSGGKAASSSPVTSTATPTSTSTATQIFKKYPQLRDKVFDLRDLGTDKTRDVLAGVDEKGDRSGSLTTAIKDWYGWENWCSANGITYRGDTRSLAIEAGKKMPPGKERKDDMDEERVDWILNGIAANSCKTSCEFAGGSDKGCWKKVLRLAGLKGSKRFFTSVFPDNPLPSPLNANAKDKVVPLKGRPKTDNNPKKGERPNLPQDAITWSQSDTAKWLEEKYRPSLAWNVQIQAWYRYGAEVDGIWSVEPDEFIWRTVMDDLDVLAEKILSQGLAEEKPTYTANYVTGIVKLLRARLAVREWDETPGLLPLKNGVLNLTTLELSPHDASYGLTWCLPYDYCIFATCDPIQEWLLKTCQGDTQLVEMLRAFLSAIIHGRCDLQSFLELIGPGGSGKSTYFNLAIALVGFENTHVTTLKRLEQSRFETASIQGKRLVVITDEERYTGEVSTLKALTGLNPLPSERKFAQSTGGFIPSAMVIVAANEPIESSDYTSGLKRRRKTVPFHNAIPENKQQNLIEFRSNGEIVGEFVSCLPGVLNWVLGMSQADVNVYIKDYTTAVPRLAEYQGQIITETNPIGDWLDYCVVHRPNARTQVGIAKRDKQSTSANTYLKSDDWLYASYCEYSVAVGHKPVAVRRFVNLLHDLCVHQLGLQVTKGRDRNASYFQGLAIRSELDDDPTFITGRPCPSTPPTPPNGENLPLNQESVVDVVDSVVDSEVDESLTGDECGGCGGFLEKSNVVEEELKNKTGMGGEVVPPNLSVEGVSQGEGIEDVIERNKECGNYPPHPSPEGVSSTTLSTTDASTSTTPPHDNLIELGEIAYKMFRCDTPAEVEKLYAEVPQELIEATKKRLGDDELLTFEAIANQCANLPPAAVEVAQGQTPDPTPKVEAITPAAQTNKDASPSDAELVAEAKRQGKVVFRYVGEMRTWGVNSLAHNVLVERLGKDRFGLLVSVQRLGEKWAQPIDVCPKLLEEI